MRKIASALTVAGVTAAGVLTAAAPANAWTTMVELHSNGVLRGKIWYNAGPHNPSKGRNSFTIKDERCNDGIGIGLRWSHAFGSGHPTVTCGEVSFSTTGNRLPPWPTTISWTGSTYSISSGGVITVGPSRSDFVY